MDILLVLIEATTFNWLAMLVALVASFVVGYIWYHKALFGTTWMQGVGLTDEKIKQGPMGKIIMGTALAMIVFIIVLSIMCGGAGLQQGIVMGGLLGVGVIAPMHITHGLFSHTPRALLWIAIGHDIVVCLVLGAIIGGR